MKKNDWLLVITILVIAILFIGHGIIKGSKDAGSVVVTVDGETFGIYSLGANQEIKINNTNQFIIKGGKVSMENATCPDQYCVHHHTISKNGESIICLPNKVVLEIRSSKASDLDAVAK